MEAETEFQRDPRLESILISRCEPDSGLVTMVAKDTLELRNQEPLERLCAPKQQNLRTPALHQEGRGVPVTNGSEIYSAKGSTSARTDVSLWRV